MSSSNPPADPDRISRIIDYLNDPTLDELPDSLKFKYTDGFDPDKLEEELQNHPFFMTEMPDPSKPLPPLLEAFQQLKYSETDNSPHELACNYKEDGVYHFKLKKYRVAAACFTKAIGEEGRGEVDIEFMASLYNNRSACMWFLKNYGSCVRDCKSALKLKPGYFKVLKRCVLSLVELERWGEVEEICGSYDCGGDKDAFSFVCEMRIKGRKGRVSQNVRVRKGEVKERERGRWKESVLGKVKERGIRVGDEKFMDGEAAMNGRVVQVGEDGGLRWPVLFMYPQFSQSDFVEGVGEGDCFTPHLIEMLDEPNRPGWDVEKEYSSSTVELYYLSSKLMRVDPESTLLDVMKGDDYVLPKNGVPCFFVLARGNAFCADFVERVEMGG